MSTRVSTVTKRLGSVLALVLTAAVFWASGAQADCTQWASGINAYPESIPLGGTSQIYWSFDGDNACPVRLNGESVGQYGNRFVSPQTSTTYVLSTTAANGSDVTLDEVRVYVAPDCVDEVSGTISASPSNIYPYENTTLTWSVLPAACSYPVRINGQVVARQGSMIVRPLQTTTYRLTTLLSGGQGQVASTTVSVTPRILYISGNSTFWKEKLVASVGIDGATVILSANVNMDLTGYAPIYIRQGVTLKGEGRNARSLGPRIFTTARPKPLFLIECNSDSTIIGDNVKILGFRLHGPHFGTVDGDANLETGIRVTSCLNVEIANMELAGWSGAAISVSEHPSAPRILNPSAVSVHDNYIHHNQHKGGNGYGVVAGSGAYVRIERNVFDFNRHAIAANGQAGTGYRAENNLVLKGGGVHGKLFNSYTHQFDVHGDANCPSFISGLWNCGNAGDQFWLYNNSFQYLRDNAIKIRGTPRVAAYLNGNVFAHDSMGDAVNPTSRARIHFGAGAQRNIVDVDTYGEYGVCDFDADGKDDLFLPTGKTWWSMSAARMHWVFLKADTRRLAGVGLGDFNGDGRCDVFAPSGSQWLISSGGSGPWTALPGTYSVPFDQLRFADFNNDGRTDIFRRAPSGQWSVVSPGIHGWRNLGSSGFPLSELRFGDFAGDGRADVLSRNGGRWSVSIGGTSPWTRLNANLNTDLKTVLIADVDGNGTDDVVRFRVQSATKGTWDVSWGGRGNWTALKTVQVPAPPAAPVRPLVGLRIFVGQFNNAAGDDLLLIDYVRSGRLYSHPGRTLLVHNLFAY